MRFSSGELVSPIKFLSCEIAEPDEDTRRRLYTRTPTVPLNDSIEEKTKLREEKRERERERERERKRKRKRERERKTEKQPEE